jgi:hypothetical protein
MECGNIQTAKAWSGIGGACYADVAYKDYPSIIKAKDEWFLREIGFGRKPRHRVGRYI